ncbi:MAG: response regulator [Leptolyngbyaceae cyanobacterium CSU_1_3]|nr:response regulator [Leptolyngbyaceae cyanobacterium CSU_1_3]
MKKILVIEDEQAVRESILDLLEAEGFRAIGGETGSVGLELARQNHPDLILCDVQMPDLDGYSVLTNLRQTTETSGIPFIFLTARGTKSDIRYGMELGADDYLTKPCTATELLGAISGRLAKQAALIQRYKRQMSIATQRATPTQSETPASPPSDHASGTRDGLLNHFYQELRNPLSGMNMALHLLRTPSVTVSPEDMVETVQREYGRELAILQQVFKLQDSLIPESADLLHCCNLVDLFDRDIDESDSDN